MVLTNLRKNWWAQLYSMATRDHVSIQLGFLISVQVLFIVSKKNASVIKMTLLKKHLSIMVWTIKLLQLV